LQGHNPGVTTASTGIYGTDMLSRRILVLFSVADWLNSISGISATCRLPLLLPAFVQQIDSIPQRLVSNSQVTLGRGQTLMSKYLLYRPNITPSFEDIGGEFVPQAVGMDRHAGFACPVADFHGDGLGGQTKNALIGISALSKGGKPIPDIVVKGYLPGFAAFTMPD
jgi:hypothetical protein